jgi:8-oxo-dGTP pyrophosphatase MutT (NUDIX family)
LLGRGPQPRECQTISRQIAALPYRTEGTAIDAPVRVLLVTSRENKRWVIPKGNPTPGMAPHVAAAQEAEEEAGVSGVICPTALGSYRYRKKRGNGASLMMDVDVFPLAVNREYPAWKEQGQRERRWFTLPKPPTQSTKPICATLSARLAAPSSTPRHAVPACSTS